ncbi:MAG: hypothetical protein ABI229_03405, partial [Gemmatimonadaceae bacterium]
PEPALLPVEREATSDGKMLDYFVRAERAVAEKAGGIHELLALIDGVSVYIGCDDARLEYVVAGWDGHHILIQHCEISTLTGDLHERIF